jgi:hypothetical protein
MKTFFTKVFLFCNKHKFSDKMMFFSGVNSQEEYRECGTNDLSNTKFIAGATNDPGNYIWS